MPHARGHLRRKYVRGRRLEEVHHRRVLERWRVRDVDDDVGALHDLGQSLACDRVDAGVRRGRYYFVAFVTELVDDLRANQPGAADDYEFHGLASSDDCFASA